MHNDGRDGQGSLKTPKRILSFTNPLAKLDCCTILFLVYTRGLGSIIFKGGWGAGFEEGGGTIFK